MGIGKRALTRVVEKIKLIIMYKNELHNSDVWTHKIEEVSLTIEEFCIFIFSSIHALHIGWLLVANPRSRCVFKPK